MTISCTSIPSLPVWKPVSLAADGRSSASDLAVENREVRTYSAWASVLVSNSTQTNKQFDCTFLLQFKMTSLPPLTEMLHKRFSSSGSVKANKQLFRTACVTFQFPGKLKCYNSNPKWDDYLLTENNWKASQTFIFQWFSQGSKKDCYHSNI